jgi:hypothetical protein
MGSDIGHWKGLVERMSDRLVLVNRRRARSALNIKAWKEEAIFSFVVIFMILI